MNQPCREYQQDWHLLALGALDADVQQEMSLHLRECAACQAHFLESRKVKAAIGLLAQPCPRAVFKRGRWLPWALLGGSVAAIVFLYAEGSRDARRYESVVALMASRPDGEVVLNVVNPEASRATARAVWWRHGGVVFFANNLPRLPNDECYQLWMLRRTSPAVVSAGLVSLDGSGRGLLVSNAGNNLDQVAGFAITNEPEGGSDIARGRQLLVGTE